MSLSKTAFTEAARPKKTKRPAPFSIRLSEEERARLKKEAGDRPLGAYIRAKLLGKRNTGIDYVTLGRILGLLGKSEQISVLYALLLAAEAERVQMSAEDSAVLHATHEDIREIRLILINALGLKSGG